MTFYQFSVEILFPFVILAVAFGMGLTLTPKAFLDVAHAPKRVIVGVFGQLVFLPLVAYLFVSFVSLPAAVAMGLILIAACPGGSSSNAIVFAIKGEVALSVMLTSISSLLILVTLPFWIQFGLDRYAPDSGVIAISSGRIIMQLCLFVLTPIGVGMVVRRLAPRFAEKAENVLRVLTVFLFIMIIGVGVYNVRDSLSEILLPVAAASLVLSLILQLSAFFIPKFLGISQRDRVTYAVEVGVQNTVLAIFVGSSLLGWDELGVVAIIYGLVNYGLIGCLILITSMVAETRPEVQK